MQKNLAWSWLPGGGCTSPQPLIWPQQIPPVGGLLSPGDLPQVAGGLSPVIENWPNAAGTSPKKNKKDQVALNMVRGQDRKNGELEKNKRERGLKDQTPGQVAFEPCPLLMQVHPLLHPGVGPIKLGLLYSGSLQFFGLPLSSSDSSTNQRVSDVKDLRGLLSKYT